MQFEYNYLTPLNTNSITQKRGASWPCKAPLSTNHYSLYYLIIYPAFGITGFCLRQNRCIESLDFNHVFEVQ